MNAETPYNPLHFWYSFPASALSAGGTDTQTLTIATNSDFRCWKLLISSSEDDGTPIEPNLVQIRLADQASGQFLMGAQIGQRILTPRAGWNRWVVPTVFPRGATITCEYTDLNNSGTNTVNVVLEGEKLF